MSALLTIGSRGTPAAEPATPFRTDDPFCAPSTATAAFQRDRGRPGASLGMGVLPRSRDTRGIV